MIEKHLSKLKILTFVGLSILPISGFISNNIWGYPCNSTSCGPASCNPIICNAATDTSSSSNNISNSVEAVSITAIITAGVVAALYVYKKNIQAKHYSEKKEATEAQQSTSANEKIQDILEKIRDISDYITKKQSSSEAIEKSPNTSEKKEDVIRDLVKYISTLLSINKDNKISEEAYNRIKEDGGYLAGNIYGLFRGNIDAKMQDWLKNLSLPSIQMTKPDIIPVETKTQQTGKGEETSTQIESAISKITKEREQEIIRDLRKLTKLELEHYSNFLKSILDNKQKQKITSQSTEIPPDLFPDVKSVSKMYLNLKTETKALMFSNMEELIKLEVTNIKFHDYVARLNKAKEKGQYNQDLLDGVEDLKKDIDSISFLQD